MPTAFTASSSVSFDTPSASIQCFSSQLSLTLMRLRPRYRAAVRRRFPLARISSKTANPRPSSAADPGSGIGVGGCGIFGRGLDDGPDVVGGVGGDSPGGDFPGSDFGGGESGVGDGAPAGTLWPPVLVAGVALNARMRVGAVVAGGDCMPESKDSAKADLPRVRAGGCASAG